MKKALMSALLAIAMFAANANAADLGYDPKADPFVQYQAAISQAVAEHKLVLVVAGGDWCRWCHVLNRFVAKNDDVERRLNETFVVMKVYVGPGNYNEAFFSQLPRAYGAPHFWVVSPQSEVLASQSTAKMERGTSTYDKERFLGFIEEWQRKLTEPERHARSDSAAPDLNL